jgi:holo-[acyl-carrier protein] synthase
MSVVCLTKLCLGTDLIYIPRVQRGLQRFANHYAKKLLTPQEWDYCQSQTQGLLEKATLKAAALVAARLAAKEAVAKALGCGLNGLGYGQGVGWQSIEVISTQHHPPTLMLHDKAFVLANQRGLTQWLLSWSHDGDYTTATALGL